VRLEDVADGPDRTIHLVEVQSPSIHWMEPRDLEFGRMSLANGGPEGSAGPSSGHPGGVNVLLADGSVRFFAQKTGPDQVRAFSRSRAERH
jgi:prepilin-type processing-associated H-X9-DG protein